MIRLFDNLPGELLSEAALTALLPYAGVSLTSLRDEHPGLLVFPDCLGTFGDNWKDEALYEFYGSSLKAGNVVGFFSVNGEQIQIQSRFDRNSAKQYFLHYMLGRVFGANLLNLPTLAEKESMWDFLLYLFPFFLKKALRQGILRRYQPFQYNDSHVRGAIDVARHLRKNIPFNGRIAYQTRELAANNPIIQQIRHTVEAIRINPMAGNILSQDSEMKEAVQTIIELTPDYNRQDTIKVIAKNLRPVRHPYFTEYSVLQKLCLKILRHEKINYGESEDKIHGIVFKAEWLWEEYLYTVLEQCGIKHSRNNLRYSPEPIYLYRDHFQVYPDFFDEHFVFDAKYKHLDNGMLREDRYQLISYIHIRRAIAGYLLYPNDKINSPFIEKEGDLSGHGGEVGTVAFSVPQSASVTSFEDYQNKIKEAEKYFCAKIQAKRSNNNKALSFAPQSGDVTEPSASRGD